MYRYNYCLVSFYSSENGTLYTIPKGLHLETNLDVEIDILNILEPPYSDNDVESFILKAFDQCYTKKRENLNSVGSLAKYFGVKRYSTAVRRLKFLSVEWDKERGYSVTPTHKIPGEGYTHLVDKEKVLGFEPKPGEIAAALRQAIEESTTY